MTANVSAVKAGAAPIRDVTIDWGDGTPSDVVTDPAQLVRHTYTAPSVYLVKATVTDQAGRTAVSKRNITVDSPATETAQTGAPG
ncbi:PKD domain-containing protein [Frankia sp. AgW1.1]|uniref:PKD domain-containing protein n=1 Tax=Frankia sp. AgW1.1 TaxID=1836971 RepID=UPI0027DB0249|nr:PKD domain-containing protein [Frankia sp. AgW1.1]